MDQFEVKFKTSAELGPGQQFEQQIKSTKQVVDELDQQFENQHQEILDSVGKSTSKLSLTKKDLLEQMKQLKTAIPGLSQVLTVVKNPIVAIAVAAAGAIKSVREFVKATEDAAQAQAMETALRSQVDTLKNLTREYESAADEFRANLAKIGEKTPVQQFEDWANQLERVRDLQEQLADKELALEKAQIRRQAVAGGWSKERELLALQGADNRAAASREARARVLTQNEYQTLTGVTMPGAARALSAAESALVSPNALAAAKLSADRAKEQVGAGGQKSHEERLAQLVKARRDAAEAAAAPAKAVPGAGLYGARDYTDLAEYQARQKALADAEAAEQTEINNWKRLEQTALDKSVAFARLEAESKKAEANLTKAAESYASLKDKERQLAFRIGTELPAQQRASQLGTQAAGVETGTRMIEAGSERAKQIATQSDAYNKARRDAWARGEPMPDRPRDLAALESQASDAAAAGKDAAAILGETLPQLGAAFQEIIKSVAQLQSQIQNGGMR